MCIISKSKSLNKFKRSVFGRSWWIYLLFDQAKHILGCHKAIRVGHLLTIWTNKFNIEEKNQTQIQKLKFQESVFLKF